MYVLEQGMLTPAKHRIPPPGVRVSPFIYLTCNSYLCFETDYSLVSKPFNTKVLSQGLHMRIIKTYIVLTIENLN
jgi:hypothetical protein